MPPHSQRGGISGSGVRRSSRSRPHSRQRTVQMLPCSAQHVAAAGELMQAVDILRDQREFGRARFQLGQRIVARIGLGLARSRRGASRTIPKPVSDRARTRRAWRDSSARYCFHRPSSPRNVGTPLSAETPAPVSTAIERASFNHSRTGCIIFRVTTGRPSLAAGNRPGCPGVFDDGVIRSSRESAIMDKT